MTTMTVREFEEEVWQVDGIRVVVRANIDEEVRDYPFERMSDSVTVSQFLRARIIERMNMKEFFIVDGHGEWPPKNALLRAVRRSYE